MKYRWMKFLIKLFQIWYSKSSCCLFSGIWSWHIYYDCFLWEDLHWNYVIGTWTLQCCTWDMKWTHAGLRFQTGVKTSYVHMKFRFSWISKQPDILIDMCMHFISGSVYIIFYHPKWNFISFKLTDMKSIPAMTFKRTCALNATSNESALIHFISGKLCSHENLMPVWVKIIDMKFIPLWVLFRLNSCEHK